MYDKQNNANVAFDGAVIDSRRRCHYSQGYMQFPSSTWT